MGDSEHCNQCNHIIFSWMNPSHVINGYSGSEDMTLPHSDVILPVNYNFG